MNATAPVPLTITYEGGDPTSGGELWGSTQVNFVVERSQAADKEVAVLLNSAAAAFLAAELGRDDTPAFRVEAAHRAGQVWIQLWHDRTGRLDSILMISKGTLLENPRLLESVRQAFATT